MSRLLMLCSNTSVRLNLINFTCFINTIFIIIKYSVSTTLDYLLHKFRRNTYKNTHGIDLYNVFLHTFHFLLRRQRWKWWWWWVIETDIRSNFYIGIRLTVSWSHSDEHLTLFHLPVHKKTHKRSTFFPTLQSTINIVLLEFRRVLR